MPSFNIPGPSIASRAFSLAGLDSAISFDILTRLWSFVSGPVTSALIVIYFTPEQQGYYYTFLSIAGLVQLIDLGGITPVIVQFMAHESARLSIDKDRSLKGGPPALSRLVSVGRFYFFWSGLWAPAVLGGLGAGGYIFLSRSGTGDVEWEVAWLALCALVTLDICTRPALTLLEGCNMVGLANIVRFGRAVASSLALWAVMVLDGGLWATPVAAAAGIVSLGAVGWFWLRRFYASFLTQPAGPLVSWKGELWPVQWRFALAGIGSVVTYGLLVPVVYHFHGPEEAGRMGFTWVLVQAVITTSSAWLNTRVPQFGILAAARDRASLDKLALRTGTYTFVIGIAGSVSLLSALTIVQAVAPSVASRMLGLVPTALLLTGGIAANVIGVMSIYMRAHKQEPMLIVSLLGAAAMLSCFIVMGKYFGSLGVASGYLSVMTIIVLPGAIWTFNKFRVRNYRSPAL